jgi:hypothetical protein
VLAATHGLDRYFRLAETKYDAFTLQVRDVEIVKYGKWIGKFWRVLDVWFFVLFDDALSLCCCFSWLAFKFVGASVWRGCCVGPWDGEV